jgi:hypothetical protein
VYHFHKRSCCPYREQSLGRIWLGVRLRRKDTTKRTERMTMEGEERRKGNTRQMHQTLQDSLERTLMLLHPIKWEDRVCDNTSLLSSHRRYCHQLQILFGLNSEQSWRITDDEADARDVN